MDIWVGGLTVFVTQYVNVNFLAQVQTFLFNFILNLFKPYVLLNLVLCNYPAQVCLLYPLGCAALQRSSTVVPPENALFQLWHLDKKSGLENYPLCSRESFVEVHPQVNQY